MLLKPKNVRISNNEEFENKLLIEKWMKRNSSSKVTIGKDIVKPDIASEKFSKTFNKDASIKEIKLSISKTEMQKVEKNTIKRLNAPNKMSITGPKTLKRPINVSKTFEFDVIQSKLLRQSLPTNYTEMKNIKNTPIITAHRKPVSTFSTKQTIVPKVSKSLSSSIQTIKTPEKAAKQEILNPPGSMVQSNLVKVISLTGTKRIEANVISTNSQRTEVNVSNIRKTKKENNTSNKGSQRSNTTESNAYGKESIKKEANANSTENLKKLLKKETDSDVYTSLLDNYRYLITPKSWSVTEFMSETKERYIVFFNAQVIQENDTLISVMKKSLIIDKNSTMSYSVHGLPVNIKGTILPRILDNTKKLLSILHIFDKMQVCEGIGSDLKITQTDFVFKDNCRYWRHKDCIIVLIKATQCSVCMDTRNLILDRKMMIQDDLINPIEFVSVELTKDEGKY